jgi:hypothetical protein
MIYKEYLRKSIFDKDYKEPFRLSKEQLEAIRKELIKYSDLNSQHRIPIHKTKVLDEAMDSIERIVSDEGKES